MKAQLLHALHSLDQRSPRFFMIEALRDAAMPSGCACEGEDLEPAREVAAYVLRTPEKADQNVVRLMKDILRMEAGAEA